MTPPLNLPAPGRCQAIFVILTISHSHMFLVNSRLGHYSAALSLERPLSLSYRTILPSSLTMNHSSALVCSTRPRVSVYGTDDLVLEFSGFSREHGYRRCRVAQKGAAYFRASAREVGLPASLVTFALKPPFPSGGGRVTSPSPRHTPRQ